MTEAVLDVHVRHYLLLAAALFSLGFYVVLTRRNAVAALMGIELILNAANINFAAFSQYLFAGRVEGQVMAIFVILLAAAEAVIALAIVLALYHSTQSVNIDEADRLRF